MQLSIITPDRNVFEGQVSLVQLPGSEGSFELLDNHAPIIATLRAGQVKIQPQGQAEQLIHITGGVLEAQANKVVILAESVK